MAENEEVKLISREKGEKRKYDPNFKGPIKNRGCTDIPCCVLFGLYMTGMIIVGIIGYLEGNPKRLLFPTNSQGKICGLDEPSKPYLYFFDLTSCITKGTLNPVTYVKKGLSCPTPQICVKSCPNFNAIGATDSDKMICTAGTVVNSKTSLQDKLQLIKDGKCAPYYLQSKPVFYRCLPNVVRDVIDSLNLKDKFNQNVTGKEIDASEKALASLLNLQNIGIQILDELRTTYYWIIVGFVIAMVLSLLYIVLSRWITFPMVIVTALGLLALFIYGIYYCFAKYKYLVDSGTSKDIVWKFTLNLDNYTRSKNTWMVLGIALLIMFVILFLIMAFLYSRVKIACGLIAEASRAVCSMLSALFFPLLLWVFQLAWFAWFIAVLLCLASNGTKEYRVLEDDTTYNITNGTVCDPKKFSSQYPGTNASCVFSKYKENNILLRLQVFHVFGWLWGANFLIALGECTLAGAFASYYWAWEKPKDIPALPVLSSLNRALSNHAGSLAFGAAIIAVVQLIRVTLEYIDRKLKENTDNPVASFIMKCLKCCFWCLEKCLRFLNKNAYIMIAIYGKGFCNSAKEVFWLFVRNPIRLLTINGVTGFLLFLGKLLVTGIIGVASFFWFEKYNANLPDKLNYAVVPILICVIGAYLVTILFFNVYDMGIDTIFLCFLEDLERHDGSEEKPYFMTKSLKKLMDVKNKQPAEASAT
ncbi:choline transporter-like protein 4 isoform X2 [Rhopilema esculentum]|uniref:choline transporter-like protein 4 isoform X2 n=1 Tax=Rhopilema esculentum TaxID=499914 RepID=UPI0031DB55FD